MLIVQVYVDDIIFGATHNDLCDEFSEMMRSEFEISMMGELDFFLRLANQANFKRHHDTSIKICQ